MLLRRVLLIFIVLHFSPSTQSCAIELRNVLCSKVYYNVFVFILKIQTALRHKSEIEHHRNKIRLRAKRKGHYEFPIVDDMIIIDTKEQQRMYRKAQMQIDKILDPGVNMPTVFIEPRKR